MSTFIAHLQKTNPTWFSSIVLKDLVFGNDVEMSHRDSSGSDVYEGTQKQRVLTDARGHTIK